MIKIESDVDLIEKVKEIFTLRGEIILPKYLDAWAEWVDISPSEIQHKDKIKVVLVEPPCNDQVCLHSSVVPYDFFSPGLLRGGMHLHVLLYFVLPFIFSFAQ